jgi:hypothetical protein
MTNQAWDESDLIARFGVGSRSPRQASDLGRPAGELGGWAAKNRCRDPKRGEPRSRSPTDRPRLWLGEDAGHVPFFFNSLERSDLARNDRLPSLNHSLKNQTGE